MGIGFAGEFYNRFYSSGGASNLLTFLRKNLLRWHYKNLSRNHFNSFSQNGPFNHAHPLNRLPKYRLPSLGRLGWRGQASAGGVFSFAQARIPRSEAAVDFGDSSTPCYRCANSGRGGPRRSHWMDNRMIQSRFVRSFRILQPHRSRN
jgi:hypothetical protein